jgi:hypothetical protein
MRLSDAFVQLGESGLGQLVRSVSLGKLRTYQMYEPFKIRARLHKLNTETLRNAAPRFWARLHDERDEEFAKELAQAVLVSHLEMITEILDFLGMPHENGFFQKDVDAKAYLTGGWQQRVFERFREKYPEALVVFYINHLTAELTDGEPYAPARSD